MKINMSGRKFGTLTGFIMGFFILHPFSMVFEGMVRPAVVIDFAFVISAFSPHHLPMAFFFGSLGALLGFINIHTTMTMLRDRERIRMLESLLPICSYCKKIRDDSRSGKNKGEWLEVDRYITMKTDTTFTHGICPECYEEMMEALDREDAVCEKEHAGGHSVGA